MKNPVAKNINKFNKPYTHKDRKKESKKDPVSECGYYKKNGCAHVDGYLCDDCEEWSDE